ncbi:Na+/H+ antiporter NhaC family protein, partial [Bacteroidota bacterium]
IGSEASAYSTFLETIPYRFYPIAMLFFVFLISWSQRDFGSMRKAEKRAILENKVSADSDNPDKKKISSDLFGKDSKARWYNGIVPILVIIIGTILGLVFTGIHSLKENGLSDYGIREIISYSDSYLAILWSSFAACIIAAVMILTIRSNR